MGYVCCMDPAIWVRISIIEAPQNGSVSESLTHTSGHRLFKSTPGLSIHPYFLWIKTVSFLHGSTAKMK